MNAAPALSHLDVTQSGEITVVTRTISFSTAGDADIKNITADVQRLLRETDLECGSVTIFAPGATGALTTLEFEPGVVHDFRRLFDQIAPVGQHYQHNVLLSDGNGHAHIRAGLLGPSMVVPFVDGKLTLGTWQEICFVCFDNRPRERHVVVQFMGI